MDRNTRQMHKGGLPECQGLRRRQHRTEHKGHTPNSRTEIKIPDPAGNRTWAAGLEGRDSTDHATATDKLLLTLLNLQPFRHFT